MLKFTTTLFLIFTVFIVSTQTPALGQSGPDSSQDAPQTAEKRDLQKVFTAETERFKSDSASFDPVKVEREAAKQQAQKQGWSKTKKVLVITAIAVGVAALLFVVIKYGKNCLRSEPANCTPGVDENCVCLEYERRNP